MLTHQGWFTALYTQHLLDSQSLEFEICIFPREAIPSQYNHASSNDGNLQVITSVKELRAPYSNALEYKTYELFIFDIKYRYGFAVIEIIRELSLFILAIAW